MTDLRKLTPGPWRNMVRGLAELNHYAGTPHEPRYDHHRGDWQTCDEYACREARTLLATPQHGPIPTARDVRADDVDEEGHPQPWHPKFASQPTARPVEPPACSECGGRGWNVEPEHDRNCDGNCDGACPVPVQVQCGDCNGSGVALASQPDIAAHPCVKCGGPGAAGSHDDYAENYDHSFVARAADIHRIDGWFDAGDKAHEESPDCWCKPIPSVEDNPRVYVHVRRDDPSIAAGAPTDE